MGNAKSKDGSAAPSHGSAESSSSKKSKSKGKDDKKGKGKGKDEPAPVPVPVHSPSPVPPASASSASASSPAPASSPKDDDEPTDWDAPVLFARGGNKKVCIDDFELKKVIGKGSFGKVRIFLLPPPSSIPSKIQLIFYSSALAFRS